VSIEQLRCFLAAYEIGSFTAAASAIGISQPSLSSHIRNLEQHLNTKLFVRVGRGVRPSDAAIALRPHAELTLRSLEQGEQAVAALNKVDGGTVRFGVFGMSRYYLGADLIEEAARIQPNLRVQLIGGSSRRVHELIRAGDLEAGLVSLPVRGDGLRIHPVAQDEIVFVSSSPIQGPVTLTDIIHRRLVVSPASGGWEDTLRQIISRHALVAGVEFDPWYQVEEIETAIALTSKGVADAIAYRVIVEATGIDQQAVAVSSFEPKIYDPLAIVYRDNVTLSQATQFIISLAVQCLQNKVPALVPGSDWATAVNR
jgi:DNA-binding transcriptional LysR family regulator